MLVVLVTILARCDGLLVHSLEIYKLLCPLLKLSLKTWLCAEPLNSSGWSLGSGLGSWNCPHSRRTQVAARAQPRIGSAHLKNPTIEREPGNNHRPDDWVHYKQLMYWQGWAVSVANINECPLEILKTQFRHYSLDLDWNRHISQEFFMTCTACLPKVRIYSKEYT